jgi:hypothetical protein
MDRDCKAGRNAYSSSREVHCHDNDQGACSITCGTRSHACLKATHDLVAADASTDGTTVLPHAIEHVKGLTAAVDRAPLDMSGISVALGRRRFSLTQFGETDTGTTRFESQKIMPAMSAAQPFSVRLSESLEQLFPSP